MTEPKYNFVPMPKHKCEHGISFDDPCEDCDPPTCSRCSGSGEGAYGESTCDSCKGKGIENE
jgi:hypothetical protein